MVTTYDQASYDLIIITAIIDVVNPVKCVRSSIYEAWTLYYSVSVCDCSFNKTLQTNIVLVAEIKSATWKYWMDDRLMIPI